MKTVTTKQNFAKMHDRCASTVSYWISRGHISRRALIGDGVRARIWVEQAERDLAASIDRVQQVVQEQRRLSK